MRIRIRRENITEHELAKALSGVIQEEGITEDVLEFLQKSDSHHEEPIPEKYIRYIVTQFQNDFDSIIETLNDNIDKWFSYQSKAKTSFSFLRKADNENPPILSQAQMDELRSLIENHFRHAIGVSYSVPKDVQKQWTKNGIEMPSEELNRWITQAYVSGRLADVLKNSSSYAEMLKAAKKLPLGRLDQLTIEAAKQNAAKYIRGFGVNLANVAEDVLVENHKSAIHDVVQAYFTGDLKHTNYNEDRLSPQEVNKLLSTDKEVRNWRELSTELKNRLKAVDVGRNWDRIAISETRFATNLGRITNIQIEGGGDPEKIFVYYHVQPTACKSCKEMFLEKDGTPKLFLLSEILKNIQETGGMQIGLKASLIGEEGGWVPNATCHANGHCYPIRKIEGYRTVPTGRVK